MIATVLAWLDERTGIRKIREVLLGPPDRKEARLDFPVISPGGVRLYVGMSVIRVPEELRAELAFVFLFRNLAETLELEDLQSLGPEAAPAPEIEAVVAESSAEAAGEGALRRRPLLALRYCGAKDLVDRAARILSADLPEGPAAIRIEGPDDLPEVLVDRDQVADA